MAGEKEENETKSNFGSFLNDLRKSRGFTLRDVEKITDGSISNGYLSQLENGNIEKPSAAKLHHLANVYAVDYHVLMEHAGFVSEASAPMNRVATSVLGELTHEEEEQLLQYLSFIRSQKR
ncbi:helix-turn-helix domain-containing protein [Sphingomonas abietis]|uniref:Helix-turn-helix transcriptional regulator n=1 Tax=Sphingomonas abietis TaxID=3012344 RepID=A0ABY7NMI0_9SPHN|nr:helix-turn-helix transcriptional regulator [Sphingomonas abietis]WBO22720.1 helix-turn-helix transcriptional regulator [Sphingomonas abietis]